MNYEDKQQIIIFVGPDRCGKSEISKQLSLCTGIPYFKASSEHSTFLKKSPDDFMKQLQYADPRVIDLLKQTGHSVIMDRGFPCEFAYSAVLNRQTDQAAILDIDRAYAKLGATLVFCHRSSYEGIKDDLDPSIDEGKLQQLHHMYETFFNMSKCKVVMLNVDDEDINREIVEIINQVEGL